MQARIDGRVALVPALAEQVEVPEPRERLDGPQARPIAIAQDRPIVQARPLALERDFAGSVEPARQVAPAWDGLVVVDHDQESAFRPGAAGRARRRAGLREVQRVEAGRRRNPVACALEQKRMREAIADLLEVVVQPPGDDRRLERNQRRRSSALRDEPFGIRRPVMGDQQHLARVDAFVADAIRGHQPQATLPRDVVYVEPRRRHRLERRAHARKPASDRTRGPR